MFTYLHSFPKKILIGALIGTLLCVLTNEINAHYLNQSLEYQYGMVQTADETSYIVPPQNWINHGEWKDNSNGLTSYYQRSPGYGLLYLVNFIIFGKFALFGLKITQICLFFASILLFWRILNEFRVKDNYSFIATLIFACLPLYSGFVYYSLTEGVTPFFVLWSIFELKRSAGVEKMRWQLIVSMACLVLIRPQLGILVAVGFLFGIITKQFRLSVAILIALLPLFAWYARTAFISNEIPSFHPIYSKTNNHFYRPSHAAMTELFKIWEWRSDVFHNQTGRLGFGDSTSIQSVLSEIPEKHRHSVEPIFRQFQSLNQMRLNDYSGEKISDFLPGELQFIKNVEDVSHELIQANKFDYYIRIPALSAKEFLNKSYLNLYVFQASWRGNWFIEALRIVCWIVVISSIGIPFLSLIIFKWNSLEAFLVLGMGAFLFYLAFVQRLNEERYIVPILPLLLLLSVIGLNQVTKKNASHE